MSNNPMFFHSDQHSKINISCCVEVELRWINEYETIEKERCYNGFSTNNIKFNLYSFLIQTRFTPGQSLLKDSIKILTKM